MSGDHNDYHMKVEVVKDKWKYNPETGEPLIDGYPIYSGLPKPTGVYLSAKEINELREALEEAVYFLEPTDEDMQKKAGVYRVVTALENLKKLKGRNG